MTAPPKHYDVIVIGAGFGGLGMGIQLKRHGRDDFIIVEQDTGVGGTWHVNRYPGAACDIPALLYCFSFAPSSQWSRRYPAQAEIESYLNQCVERFDLEPHLHLRTKVKALHWDADTQRWTVHAEQRNGESVQWTARVIANATGGLSRPAIPDFPGLHEFQGPVMHTARWQGEISLADKRIGVVGTGASGVQVFPQLVNTAARALLFQRTPAWILPKPDRPVSARRRWLYDNVPGLRRVARALLYVQHELRAPGFTRRPGMLKALEPLALRRLHRKVADPALREALTPRYRMGCKRILLASDFYPALQRRNAKLVTSPIARVVADGIVTADGEHHPLDVLVLATGFQAAEDVAPFVVRGRDGVELSEAWRAGASAYLGTTVPGFPNLFLIVGPNTGLGHNSMVFMIESQLRYVIEALARMDAAQVGAVDAKPDVAATFNLVLQERMKHTVWKQGACTSWYHTRDGLITTLWPWSSLAFWQRTRRFRLAEYDTFAA